MPDGIDRSLLHTCLQFLLAKSKDNIWITASCVTVGKVDPTNHPHFQEANQSIHN
uniref:Uncharacterized protein n=1 Tax=Arundo donax TaxID=35708 RepID=A0A0A9EQC1_ARUDO